MTRPQTRTYGVATPSTRQPLLEAMLRAFAWLASNVASLLGVILPRNTRAWHTGRAEGDQLQTPSDLHNKETCQAEPTGLSTGSGPSAAFPAEAGIQTPHAVRKRNPSALRALTGPPPSRGMRFGTCALLFSVIPGEGAQRSFDAACGVAQDKLRPGTPELRASSLPLIPTNVGIQGGWRTLSELAASSPYPQQKRSWIPTFVGMSGVCRGLLHAKSA